MGVDLVRVPSAAAVPYAYASVAPAGARLVHTAGACPLDAGGAVVAPGDVAAQAAAVMDNLDLGLRAAGTGLADVVRRTV